MRLHAFEAQKEPGFRLSVGDLLSFGLALAAWRAILEWPGMEPLAPLPLHIFATFFVFCNVCRIATALEVVWGLAMVASVAAIGLLGLPLYPALLVPTSIVMLGLVAWSAAYGKYDGVGHGRIATWRLRLQQKGLWYPNPFEPLDSPLRRKAPKDPSKFTDWVIGNMQRETPEFDLGRFLRAQDGIYEQARAEIAAGRKHTHWIWFVFPQLAGLGSSPISEKYAIRSMTEAKAYLADPVLSGRLSECVAALLAVEGKTAREIFGVPDDLKVRSSMTLFSAITPYGSPFWKVLDKYYQGSSDIRTVELIEEMDGR